MQIKSKIIMNRMDFNMSRYLQYEILHTKDAYNIMI